MAESRRGCGGMWTQRLSVARVAMAVQGICPPDDRVLFNEAAISTLYKVEMAAAERIQIVGDLLVQLDEQVSRTKGIFEYIEKRVSSK